MGQEAVKSSEKNKSGGVKLLQSSLGPLSAIRCLHFPPTQLTK